MNTGTRLKELIDKKAEEAKKLLSTRKSEGTTLTNFSKDNRAINPASDGLIIPNHLNNKKSNSSAQTQKEHPFVTYDQLSKILKKLPNKTSSGPDEIPSIILKHLPPRVIRNLVIIFNNATNHTYFPDVWKSAKVLIILKKDKDPSKSTSYRPISLTSNLGNVYEMTINNHLVQVCTKEKIMHDLQFGFRAKHSTTYAIHKIIDTTMGYLQDNLRVAVALIDLEKAFDSVWINGLIYKLVKLGFSDWLTLLIIDMITGRTFGTWDGINLSNKTYKILEGLQQGTVNSPLLSNIFTMALLQLFNLNIKENLFAVAYADDIIVGVAGKNPPKLQNQLEKLVNNINEYYKIWNLRMNPEKCETAVFRRESNHLSKKALTQIKDFQISTPSPNTNEMIKIPHKTVVKYLGVHIDQLLRIRQHPDIQLVKAKAAFKSNSRIFYNKYLS